MIKEGYLRETVLSTLEYLLDVFNTAIFPLKVIVPQPIVRRIPGLTSTEDIRLRAVLRHVDGYLLDIGCKNNKLVGLYKSMGGRGVGVDVYQWKGVDILVERSDRLPFENNTFDTVSLVACLNHIPYRPQVLKEVHRVIKPGGRLLVTNPPPLLSAFWHKWAFWDEDAHERGMKEGEVYGLTMQELSELFSNSSFTILKIERFMWKMNRLYICAPSDK